MSSSSSLYLLWRRGVPAVLRRTQRSHFHQRQQQRVVSLGLLFTSTALVGGGGGCGLHHHYSLTTTTRTSAESRNSSKKKNDNTDDNNTKNKDGGDTTTTFDLTKEWERAKEESSDFLQRWILTDQNKTPAQEDSTDAIHKVSSSTSSSSSSSSSLPLSFRNRLEDLFSSASDDDSSSETTAASSKTTQTRSSDADATTTPPPPDLFVRLKDISSVLLNPSQEERERSMQKLVETAHQSLQRNSDKAANVGDDATSLSQVWKLLQGSLEQVLDMMERSFGHIDLQHISPTALYYYVEHEDELKNPSWKRRLHRFHSGVHVEQIHELNDALTLAELSYADSVEEIQKGLDQRLPNNKAAKMIYCETESFPGRPSHFLLLPQHQSVWSDALEVVMVVRGTKHLTDVITDCLLEAADYRDDGGEGKVHAGMLDAGRYLVRKHLGLLRELRDAAPGKRKIRLTLVGHSLGAGAAVIAGMEFQQMSDIFECRVIGFGCPALLSKELSESTRSFVTTVINDADVIPRTSGATVANVLLDVMEYDWIDKARLDTEHALRELERVGVLADSTVGQLLQLVDSSLENVAKPLVKSPTTERMTPVLFPPGTCIHLYHDGSGVTGSISPCTMFSEIDVTRRMIDDHLIAGGYRRIFLDLMRQHRRDENFRFDDIQIN